MKDLTATYKTALKAPRVRMAILVLINLETGLLYLTNSSQTLTVIAPGVGSQEWLGAGRLLDIEFPQEDASMETHAGQITLDGLDVTMTSLALNERLEHRPVTLFLALFNPDTNVSLGPALQIVRGTMSNVRILPPTVGYSQ